MGIGCEMAQTISLDYLVKEGIMKRDQWYASLTKMINTGAISNHHIQKIDSAASVIAKNIRKYPLSIQRNIIQTLNNSWEHIADTSNMPLLSAQEKDTFFQLYSSVAEAIPQKHLTINLIPIAVAKINHDLKNKENSLDINKSFEEYLIKVGISHSLIENILEQGPISLMLESTPSFNKGLHLRNEQNQNIFLKIYSGNPAASASILAELEALANYHLSQIPQLRKRVVGTPSISIQEIGDMAIGVQYDISEEADNQRDICYWLDGYALLTQNSPEKLASLIPRMKKSDFEYERISDMISFISKEKLRELKSIFNDGAALVEGDNVVLTDTKEENRKNGREIDLERLRIGNLALPLPLLLASYGIKLADEESINHYVTYYAKELDHNTADSDIQRITHDLKYISYPIILKEISGIESRRKTPSSIRQRSYLCNYLGITQ